VNLADCIAVINMMLPIIGAQRSRVKKTNVKDENGDISITKKRATRSRRYASLNERLSAYASLICNIGCLLSDLALRMIKSQHENN